MNVHYSAFGEMAVTVDGVRRPLTRRRERAVLSVLLCAHGAPVTAERLVAEVWGEEEAGRTLAPLQVAVSRLRNTVEPGRVARTGTRLVSTAAGYSLRADVDDVDTWTFEARAEEALACPDPAQRLARCDDALALWTAAPYADTEAPTVRAESDRLGELHLTLHEQRARALLDLGRPGEAHRMLAELATRHAYRERMWSLLALAQYQSSRQADALATLRTLRTALADELGVDPLPETRQLEEAMLRQDSSLDRIEPVPTAVFAPAPRPAAPAAPVTASVGRVAVLDQLRRVHARARETGRTTFVMVAGEAGIGKSALVSDLAASLTEEGSRVLVGHCLEGDYAPALWPWLDVVRPLAADAHSELDPLLGPLLSGEPPPAGSDGAGTTLRMFDAVVELLVSTASRNPLLIVLEDLHWADTSSLLLLRHLATLHPAAGITVVCTRRTADDATGEALVDAMADLARAGAERIRLDGLDLASVRHLLDGPVGPHEGRLDRFVTDVTGGNPFFVLQYARLLATTPTLDDLRDLPVPDGIRDVLRQRLARLPESAMRLLASASVLGRGVDPDLLAELTGVPVDDCLDALDLALTSGLLVQRDAGYAFVHALARETVYADLSTARRMRLHDQAGRLVERRRADDADAAAEIAHHAHVAAPLSGDHARRACEWLTRAAQVAVSRHAHPEALELWQRMLSDATPESLTAADGYRGAAAALIRLGRMSPAHEALETAVRIASEHEDWTMVAESAAILSGAGPWSWREHGVLHTPFVDVLTAALPHVAADLEARLLAILQLEHYYAWKTHTVEEYGRCSVELARECGDTELLGEVLMLRLVASSGSWDTPNRLALATELLSLEPRDDLLVVGLFHLGHARWDSGDPAGADETLRRCAEAAAELRHSGLEIPLGWWRAARARDRDDPDHDRLIDEALAIHRRDGYMSNRELECMHAVRRGPAGVPVSDATLALAEQCAPPVRTFVAHALLEEGRPDAAYALLGEPIPDAVVDDCSTATRCLRLLVLTETGTEQEIVEALAPVEHHLGALVNYGTIDHLGVVDHFVAAAYAALGDPRAVEVARSAVELNRRIGVGPWLRRSEELLAHLS